MQSAMGIYTGPPFKLPSEKSRHTQTFPHSEKSHRDWAGIELTTPDSPVESVTSEPPTPAVISSHKKNRCFVMATRMLLIGCFNVGSYWPFLGPTGVGSRSYRNFPKLCDVTIIMINSLVTRETGAQCD